MVGEECPQLAGGADLRLGRWQDVLGDVECDLLCVDAPYSERTHAGHDGGTGSINRANVGRRRADGRQELAGWERRSISYEAWSADDVQAFVSHWSDRTRGWFVSLTDHVLAPAWEQALRAAGRYVFSPIACVEPGSRVRLTGDGPTQWCTWCVVARPTAKAFFRWGSLPGAYVVPSGMREVGGGRKDVVGGKPLWLMQALVRDYSRAGDLVCDPCSGAGSTLLAAVTERRRAVGAEMDPAHYEIAKKRLLRGYTPVFDFGPEVA